MTVETLCTKLKISAIRETSCATSCNTRSTSGYSNGQTMTQAKFCQTRPHSTYSSSHVACSVKQ
ncbi:Hypothetical protein FKW44_011083 [Caligus rogercresseyi]|uniref:Uncharacterized protein n=1 Tax=Caligus rogercresseyi TaxID=217165 RepID=A0A7T8KA11_CALRO|nr:Hypothetical protein FKW44_011083 [Caligus rogercresseyi]